MSLSTLPEWKQLLLERKRREEEEKERREREEEERLANMPAWKRGIIQRRKAKQDEEREKERGKEGGQTPNVFGIREDIVTEQRDRKVTFHMQTDPEPKAENQIPRETISPIRQNPFLCSENSWRRNNRKIRDGENSANVNTGKEGSRGKERELENKSEGKEKHGGSGKEQVNKCREVEASTGLFSPSTGHFLPSTGLHTIKANNIIIIEKETNSKDRQEGNEQKVVQEEETRMRMDLREFLAGGGSVTEIRASEVLIIKPPITEARTAGVKDRVSSREHLEREKICRHEISRTVMRRADRLTNHRAGGATESGGRVSQLLSKFGETPKPPMRSKSTDCFEHLGENQLRNSTGDLFVQEELWTEEEDTGPIFRGVPKRSFSFSERVVCPKENGVCEEELECKMVQRTYSDRRVQQYVMVTDRPKCESRAGRPHKHDEELVMHEKRQKGRRMEKVTDQTVCRESEENVLSAHGEQAFARRVPIKEISSETDSKRVCEDDEREMKIGKAIQREKRQEEVIEKETMEIQTEFQMEQRAESKRRWNQDEGNMVACFTQSHSTHIPPLDTDSTEYNTVIDRSVDVQCQDVTTLSVDSSLHPSNMVLFQETEDLHCHMEKVKTERDLDRAGQMFSCGDQDVSKINQNTVHTVVAMSHHYKKEHKQFLNLSKQAAERSHFPLQLSQQAGPLAQNKPCTQEEVTIPRTVFYGVNVSAERRISLPAGDGKHGGVERRASWKSGRPLTRVESLRDRICQQEERQRDRNAKIMDGREEDRRKAEGTIREVTQTQQEETALQTFKLFDVTQEVTNAKPSPQLPVPVALSHLQSASAERESGEIFRETEPACHVEECGTRSIWRRQNLDGGEDKRERELLEDKYLSSSVSPSPPLSDSLDTMSRIYNLKSAGSRTTVCISERKSDISIQGSQGQYKPIKNAQSPDILPETARMWNYGTARDCDKTEAVESTDVQMVQRQVKRMQLKEREAGCGSHSDREAQLSTEQEVRTAEGQKKPDILRQTQKSQTLASSSFPQTQLIFLKPQQGRSFTINAQSPQSTENSSKAPQQDSCPSSSSPCTPSPSPPLFSIRSASSGPGKRGTTITITPRRTCGVAPSGGASTGTGPIGAPSKAVPQGQVTTSTTSGNKEAGKKRYPTAEEIEVIGGYQYLGRSCLVKNRGTSKVGKVCFSDTQLERVCEYPSENSPHSGLGGVSDEGRCEEEQGAEGKRSNEEGEEEEEAEEENGALGPCSVSAGRVRFLKVDESCKQ